MDKKEAIQTILNYERTFKELGGSGSIPVEVFRKYNDAKYWMTVHGLKKDRKGTNES